MISFVDKDNTFVCSLACVLFYNAMQQTVQARLLHYKMFVNNLYRSL